MNWTIIETTPNRFALFQKGEKVAMELSLKEAVESTDGIYTFMPIGKHV